MSKYDGPTFFRKDNPKVKPIQKDQQAAPEQPKYKLPQNVRTRNDLKDEARQHMETRKTPSTSIPHDPPPERFPFKNKHIPTSLQNRGGRQTQNKTTGVYGEIQQRLKKNEDSYLLFEEHLSDEMKTKVAIVEEVAQDNYKVEEKSVSTQSKQPEKVADKKKEVTKNVLKPPTGLHRSLSNIMAEEHKGIQKSKHKLNSLFNEEEKGKKR